MNAVSGQSIRATYLSTYRTWAQELRSTSTSQQQAMRVTTLTCWTTFLHTRSLHTTHVWHSYARSTPCFKKAMTFLFLITLTKWNDFNNFCHVESFQKLSSLHRRSWLCSILLWNVGILRNTSKVVVARNNSDNNRLNKLSPRGRRDDIPLADGSSTRGGSTSVRPRTGPQSAHGYAAGSRRA